MEISSFTATITLPKFQNPTIIYSSNSSLFINRSTSYTLRSTNIVGGAKKKKGFACNSMFGLGVPEMAVIAGVAALVFGPKQIPLIGRSFGQTVKGFQQAAKEFEAELKKTEETKSDYEVIDISTLAISPDEKESLSVTASSEN